MRRASSSKIVPWLLLGVVALIAYGSLYPFNFKPDAISGGVLDALGQLSWQRAGRGDRISNVLLYLPLGFCLVLWLRTRVRRVYAVLLATGLGALLSLSIEVAQVYVSARVPSLTDLVLNTLGSAIGALGGLAWRWGATWMHSPPHAERPTGDPGALLLVGLWLLWRFAPFIPHFDLGKLKAALRPLFDPQIDAQLTFAFLVCWTVVSQALTALVSRARLLEALLALIAIVLAGRLLVVEQVFVPSELLALILLLPTLVLLDRLTSVPRKALLAGAVLVVFLGNRLAPFRFESTASAFDFWPFMVWFEAGIGATLRSTDWTMLCGETFLFGAVLWTLRHCGMSTKIAAAVMLALAIVTEVMQLWIAGHTGSLTDPALAVAVAVAFNYVDARTRRRSTLIVR
ncbi:MAG TPA: VanZ family protein [Steroidobacteraceae bacterium]